MAFLPALQSFASTAVHMAMNTLFPPRCYACNQLTGAQDGLCAACWDKIRFIAAPYCARCGVPFPYEMGGADAECMPCIQSPPLFSGARAVFCYDEDSRALITGYKYHDRTHATPMYGNWLARAGVDILMHTDVIVPVPLHRLRLIKRRYNQSALLATALAKEAGKPILMRGLERIRHTPQQAGLTREQRLKNVEDAFAVPPPFRSQVNGQRVLIVDDVLTTGATLNACTQALLDAGAKDVYLLTLARTVGEEI